MATNDHSPPSIVPSALGSALRWRRLAGLACAAFGLALLAAAWHAQAASVAQAEMRNRFVQIEHDVRVLQQLERTAPSTAPHTFTTSNLLTAFQQALDDVKIPAESLASAAPQGPMRIGRSRIVRRGYRLTLQNVALEPLSAALHALRSRYPAVTANGIHLQPASRKSLWDINLEIAYLFDESTAVPP